MDFYEFIYKWYSHKNVTRKVKVRKRPGVCVCVLSQVQLFLNWTVAHQAPLSTGFSRQECRSGLPFPYPRDLPDPEIEPTSLARPALADHV